MIINDENNKRKLMNYQSYRMVLLMILIVIFSLSLLGCSVNSEGDNYQDLNSGDREINIDKLEVFHFHATRQCYSCVTLGDYAKETLETYFKDEMEDGVIVFKHIKGDDNANKDVVLKYGATGSSLWLGTYKDGEFKAEENVNVWYRLRNKQDFMNYLKGEIENKLRGN